MLQRILLIAKASAAAEAQGLPDAALNIYHDLVAREENITTSDGSSALSALIEPRAQPLILPSYSDGSLNVMDPAQARGLEKVFLHA